MTSTGTGNMMVLLFSAEMLLSVWRYRNCVTNYFHFPPRPLVTCRAAGLSMMTSAACLRARLDLCSPSAAITLARAFLAASASAAMALWRFSGTLTSFTSTLSTKTPQGSVASSSPVLEITVSATRNLPVSHLHFLSDGFSLGQNVAEVSCSQDVPDVTSHQHQPTSSLQTDLRVVAASS